MTREDSIRYFVESAREVLWSRKTLDGWLLLYLMFAAMPVYAGFQVLKVEKNPDTLIVGSLSALLVIFVIFYLSKVGKKEETYLERFITTGIGSTVLSLQFLILGIFIPVTTKSGAVNIGMVIGIYILFVVIIFGLALYSIKKEWYRPSISAATRVKNAKVIKKIMPLVVLGTTAGGLIFKSIIDDLSSYEDEKVVSICFVMPAIIFIFGMTNFLKAYYVKKYGFTDPYEDGWYKPKRRKLKEAENEEAEIEGEKSK